MNIELDSMTLSDLRDLQKKVARQIETFETRQKQKALQAAQEAIADYGYSLKDLVEDEKALKPKVAPKYAQPGDGSVTWTGRGRQPRWVKEHLDAGGSLADLQI